MSTHCQLVDHLPVYPATNAGRNGLAAVIPFGSDISLSSLRLPLASLLHSRIVTVCSFVCASKQAIISTSARFGCCDGRMYGSSVGSVAIHASITRNTLFSVPISCFLLN